MACSRSCRERKRAARIGLEAERGAFGHPSWRTNMAKAAKQIVFSRSRDIPFNKHHAAVPADAVYIDRGSK
jgi:hypothetical protein